MSNTESTATSEQAQAPALATGAEPPAGPRLWRWLDTTTKKVVAVAVGLGAIFGLVLGGLDLYDRIFKPPKPIGATIDVLERPVLNKTLGQFLVAHPGAFAGSFTPVRLSTNGDIFTVRLGLKGLHGKDAALNWAQLDGSTDEPLPIPAWVPRRLALAAASDDDQLTREVWVPIPLRGDSMLVRFQVTVPERTDPLIVEDGPAVPIG